MILLGFKEKCLQILLLYAILNELFIRRDRIRDAEMRFAVGNRTIRIER